MESFLRAANATSAVPRGMPAGLTTPLQESDLAPTKPDVRKRSVLGQVHRTISRNDLGNVPAPTRTDVLEGYLKAIALAERFVYIENQYFRSEALADALIARHRKQKALKTLILLPHVAEELIAGRADPISMHGAALQHEVIDRMQKEVGSSLGIFALTNRNGEQVYVHSKLLIIDDRYGNIGSANANPRSFLMDTEMNFAWYDPATVRRLRLRLWREHLGSQRGLRSWKPNQFVTHWTRIAERNARIAPARREGFVMPFENSLSGQRNVLIPDEFAALMGPGDYSVV